MPPSLVSGVSVSLQKGLADCGGHHRVLALRDVRQGVSHPMHATTLPGSTKHSRDGVAQPVVSIRDHQLHAFEPALDQAFQKARPERLRLRRADAEPDDLAPAVARHRHGDYRRHRDDATAVADLQIGRVEPQIRPLAFERPVEEGVHALIDLLHSFETWLFEMPLSPIACTSSSTRRVDTPPIQASWITVTSAFSAVRGSRKGGKYDPW